MRVAVDGARTRICNDCYPGRIHVELDVDHPGTVNVVDVEKLCKYLWAELAYKVLEGRH